MNRNEIEKEWVDFIEYLFGKYGDIEIDMNDLDPPYKRFIMGLFLDPRFYGWTERKIILKNV